MLNVTHYTVNSPKIVKAFDNFKIIQLSDLHGRIFSHNYRKILAVLEKISPDIVVLTGDMADNRLKQSIGHAELLCKLITRKFITYFVQGNHEQTMKPDELGGFLSNLERSGVYVLDNKKCVITRDSVEIILNGLVTPLEFYNDPLHEYRKGAFLKVEDISQLLGNGDDRCYNILITHNPVFFETYSAWGADLILSGHIHGGVICIPGVGGVFSPDVTFFPKYYAGEYEWEESRMIVSRGLNNRFPFSITNPSEIVCITLRSGEKIKLTE